MDIGKSLILLTHDYPPYVFGGTAIYSQQLAEGLADRGWAVYVVAGRVGFREGVAVHRKGSITVLRVYFPSSLVEIIDSFNSLLRRSEYETEKI